MAPECGLRDRHRTNATGYTVTFAATTAGSTLVGRGVQFSLQATSLTGYTTTPSAGVGSVVRPIRESDLAALSTLDLSAAAGGPAAHRIRDLTGLAAARNLRSLNLANNDVSDLTPLQPVVLGNSRLEYLVLDRQPHGPAGACRSWPRWPTSRGSASTTRRRLARPRRRSPL